MSPYISLISSEDFSSLKCFRKLDWRPKEGRWAHRLHSSKGHGTRLSMTWNQSAVDACAQACSYMTDRCVAAAWNTTSLSTGSGRCRPPAPQLHSARPGRHNDDVNWSKRLSWKRGMLLLLRRTLASCVISNLSVGRVSRRSQLDGEKHLLTTPTWTRSCWQPQLSSRPPFCSPTSVSLLLVSLCQLLACDRHCCQAPQTPLTLSVRPDFFHWHRKRWPGKRSLFYQITSLAVIISQTAT